MEEKACGRKTIIIQEPEPAAEMAAGSFGLVEKRAQVW